MDVLERKVENQVQFWSLLGPFLILLSIAILLFKVSDHWYFPLSALIGVPLCVKWKMKGMAAALSCLFLLFIVAYQNLELDERYWHVGMGLAMAFSFIVLTLSLEEVHSLIDKLQLESQSRLDNFLRLDEKWKMADQEWFVEKERLEVEVRALTQEMTKVQEDKQTFYKIAQLAKDELLQVRTQHDLVLQELFYKKQLITQLNERLEETECTIQGFINSDAEKQVQHLIDCRDDLEREKERLKAQIALIQDQCQSCQQEKECLNQELQANQEHKNLLLAHREEEQTAFQGLQQKHAVLEQEHSLLMQAQKSLAQQYEQMCHLESQHRQSVRAQLGKIQELEKKLTVETQQKEVLIQNKKEMELHLDQLGQQMKHLEAQLQAKLQQAQQQFQGQLQDIHAIRDNYHQLKQLLEVKENIIVEANQKIQELSAELKEQQAVSEKSLEKVQEFDQLKRQWEEDVRQAHLQIEQFQQRLESIPASHERLPYAPGNTRSTEAMYIQLKGQFQEKSDILKQTRRKLFHVQEELLCKQKNEEEEHVFGQSMNERYLQRDFLRLGRQHEKMMRQYQQEIDDLMHLIGHLFYQMQENVKSRQ